MDTKTYTLYTDGVKLAENLTKNGTNYVSIDEVDVSSLPPVFKFKAVDNEGDVAEEYLYAKLLQQVQYEWDDNKYYLAFAPVSQQEIMNAEFKANIDYLAMVADVDIDE